DATGAEEARRKRLIPAATGAHGALPAMHALRYLDRAIARKGGPARDVESDEGRRDGRRACRTPLGCVLRVGTAIRWNPGVLLPHERSHLRLCGEDPDGVSGHPAGGAHLRQDRRLEEGRGRLEGTGG